MSGMTMIDRMIFWLAIVLLSVVPANAQAASGAVPLAGSAAVSVRGTTLSLSNAALTAEWSVAHGGLEATSFTDRSQKRMLKLQRAVFLLTFEDGTVLKSSAMRVVGEPRTLHTMADENASQMAARRSGQKVALEFEDKEHGLQVQWSATLRDDTNYVRQEVTLSATGKDVPIRSVRLVDVRASGIRVAGTVKGSPLVAGNLFFGFEHPLAESKAASDHGFAQIARQLPLKAGQSVTYSAVMGVTLPGQLRRGFLNYVEQERAHPYRTFLHYNSWYDLGYFSKYGEADVLKVIEAFGTELVKKRGVTMDSLLFDDGWDDPKTLWHFHSGFPKGFAPVREAAARYGMAPGVWLSPWGGYDKPREERLEYAKKQGFETNEGGLALSGPKYYERFREITLEFIRKYGVNQFKIDGTGNADSAVPGATFDSDFQAAISLIREWRGVKPDIYVNLTTGTYPSPFWLQYADSIWRGGEDHSFLGVGSWRQRWMTYRDADTYAGVVMAGPLYPLNALMLHGLIYAKSANHLDTDPGDDFAAEIHSYFGTGTQLQEMYVTPSLLTAKDWDTLAEAARWSRSNADVLRDTHWVGGDPALLEVYGWASWSPRKGILVLRNPSDHPQEIALDVKDAFELPAGAGFVYHAHSPWKDDAALNAITLRAGTPYRFQLRPFEVLTLEAEAVRK
jgi:hypothetical protein